MFALSGRSNTLKSPSDFPELNVTYTGRLYFPEWPAEFRIQSVDEASGIYSGTFWSHKISYIGDPKIDKQVFEAATGQFKLRQNPESNWTVTFSQTRNFPAIESESASWVQTQNGPTLVTDFLDGEKRYWFQLSGIPQAGDAPKPLAYPLIIPEPEIVEGGVIRSWTSSDGLAHNATRCMTQTSDGAIWIGTVGGLSRFDGSGFINYHPNSTPALPDENVRCLLELSDGTLAVGTKSKGVFLFDGYEFKSSALVFGPDSIPSSPIKQLVEDPSGCLWALYDTKLFRLDGDMNVREFSIDDLNPKWPAITLTQNLFDSLVAISAEEIFVSMTGRLMKWNPITDERVYCDHASEGIGNLIPLGSELLVWSTPAGDLTVDLNLNVVAYTELIRRANGRPLFKAHEGTGFWSEISMIYRTEESKRLPELFFHDQTRVLGYKDSPKMTNLCGMLEDQKGNIWMATDARGLQLFIPPIVKNESKAWGSLGNRVTDVSSSHQLFPRRIGQNFQESREDPSKINLAKPEFLPKEFQYLINNSPEKKDYLGFEFTPLGFIEKDGYSKEILGVTPDWSLVNAINMGKDYPLLPALVEYSSNSAPVWIYPDSDEPFQFIKSAGISQPLGVYLATEKGILSLKPGEEKMRWWKPSGQTAPLNKEFSAIWVDTNERVWMATSENDVFCETLDPEGLKEKTFHFLIDTRQISTIYEDPNKTIWVTSADTLTRITETESGFKLITHPFPHSKRLSPTKPVSVVADQGGYLWYGFNHGIQGYPIESLNQYMENPSIYPEFILLNEDSGLKNVSSESFFYPSAALTDDGEIFFRMIQHDITFDPQVARKRTSSITASIQRISTGDQDFFKSPILPTSTEIQKTFRFPPTAAYGLNFDFSVQGLTMISAPLFTHRLIGYSDSWSPLSNYDNAFYAKLKPGKYRFELKACDENGALQQQVAFVDFYITPFFYQTTIFKFLAGTLLCAMCLFWVYQLDQRRKLKLHDEKERGIQLERMRIAQHMHDDLGASLAKISLQVGMALEDPKRINLSLARDINGFTKDAAKKMREIIWYLNPESCAYNSFCDYVSSMVVDYFNGSNVEVNLKIQDSDSHFIIGYTFKRDWINILKSLMANVIQHSKATRVEFQFGKLDDNWIEARVKDNGIGFDPSEKSRPDSTGLRSIQNRMRQRNGEVQIESKPGNGACVVIRIPFDSAV